MKDEGGGMKERAEREGGSLHPSSFILHPSLCRVFCAIELSPDARKRIIDFAAHLRRVRDASVTWSREENLHLTLKFLGEIPGSRVDDLSRAAACAVEGLSPFNLVIEQTGAFPKQGPPRVLWVGITDHSGKLTALQVRLEDECAKEGFAGEPRPFHPHLTLARLRKPQGARALGAALRELAFEPIEISASELLVIRSDLGREGSRYTVISQHSFRPKSNV